MSFCGRRLMIGLRNFLQTERKRKKSAPAECSKPRFLFAERPGESETSNRDRVRWRWNFSVVLAYGGSVIW